jgi:hypothetical protein
MAEIELHTLNTQCLKRNIATMEEMQSELRRGKKAGTIKMQR